MPEDSVYVKIWRVRPGETMIAVCDSDLLGKKICEGRLVLDASKEFYGGDEVSSEAATDALKKATVANLVGKKAVRCGIEAGLVHDDAIICIGGVPHAQFVLI